MALMGRIFIGCSGFSYDHWRGIFYPEDLPKTEWLGFYSSQFNAVEINSTFYHLPKKTTTKKWADNCPSGFLYVVKMWRQITHYKRLKEAQEPIKVFISRVEALIPKIAAVLVQLPPGLHKELDLLKSFLRQLPSGIKFAFEFRHKSWYEDDTYRVLEEAGAHFVIHDYQGKVSPKKVIGDLAYIRFHGPEGNYRGSYGDAVLADWARFINDNACHGKTCLAFFNNDFEAMAPANAKTLLKLIETSVKG